MSVELTDLAEEGLREIHCRFPKEKALKIVDKILNRAETLSTLASRGRIVKNSVTLTSTLKGSGKGICHARLTVQICPMPTQRTRMT